MRQDAAIQYRFGRFVVQPRERRLLVDGQPVLAGPRAFDVLLALIERAGQLVTKDELLGRVWPKLIVEENNLQVQVSALRKILGQDAIATIPGQGYRFTPVAKLIEGEIADFALAHTHNLPQPLTSFVGHENDLAEYAQMLRETRLLTLTGIGGCGKTRLAIELARLVLPSFPDGVRFVDLAPVTEADRVATAVAVALEVREQVDQPVEETLVRHVADRRLLIVLDNCEHLLDACAALVERLLTAAPGIRALITSREGFGIAGERIMRVRSLALPSPTAAADCEVIGMFESVRLFLDRVRHVAVDFVLSESNAGAIADICRRLDGIPLALELAAARVKLLSVEQIRERLDDRFRLLTGNSRAMSRHQTLLATLQWSYEHLAPDQQRLLRRLSVFSDGWTLDGAIRVGGETEDEYAVLDLLERLVDQSLVTTKRVDGHTVRYAMLETVRQYARDRLNEAGEAAATRTRHLDFYLAVAEEAKPQLRGPEQSRWLARLDDERENFLAAHAWCDGSEELADPGLRLAFSLNEYFVHRGLTALGHRMTVEALARPGAQNRNLARCRALWASAALSYFAGRYGEAKDHVESSLSISREIADSGSEGEALRLLGYVLLAQGSGAVAGASFLEALTLSRRLENKLQLSRALNALAVFHAAHGRQVEARALFEEAVVVSRDLGDRVGVAIALSNLAATLIDLGFGDCSRAMVEEGLAIAEEIGSKYAGYANLNGAMELAAHFNDWEVAARLHGATETLLQQIGNRREAVDSVTHAPFVARTKMSLGAAAFAAAESAGRALSYQEAIAEARLWLGKRS